MKCCKNTLKANLQLPGHQLHIRVIAGTDHLLLQGICSMSWEQQSPAESWDNPTQPGCFQGAGAASTRLLCLHL